jgi:hypothetical protein
MLQRSSGLLCVEASRVRVLQYGLKTGGGAVRIVHRVKAEDGWVDATGYIGPFYPYFVVFIVLGTRGILVF